MHIMDATAGRQVYLQSSPKQRGTISGASHQNDHCVIVEWDNGLISREDVEDLMQELSPMEKDYQEAQLKIDQAAQLLKEASIITATYEVSLYAASCNQDIDLQALQQAYDETSIMSQGERSLLFYVLDALRNRPEQWREVLRLVEESGASTEFRSYVRKLQAASSREAVLTATEEVRSQIL